MSTAVCHNLLISIWYIHYVRSYLDVVPNRGKVKLPAQGKRVKMVAASVSRKPMQ